MALIVALFSNLNFFLSAFHIDCFCLISHTILNIMSLPAALFIKHAVQMRRTLSSVPCLYVP